MPEHNLACVMLGLFWELNCFYHSEVVKKPPVPFKTVDTVLKLKSSHFF